MQEIKYSELDTLIKNKDIDFYNIYNCDLNTTIFHSNQHYLNNPDDNTEIEQKLHILFSDIEVYWKDRDIPFNFDIADHPINAFTVYSTEQKIFKSFYLLYDFNYQQFGITANCNIQEIINNHINDYKNWLLKEKYINEYENIEINIYNNELQLLLDTWKYIRSINPHILSGFNSDNFDYPYIYKRLLKLYNDDKQQVDSIISQFGYIEISYTTGLMKIIDYPICDIQYCYKVRGDGGLNLGKKLASYSLDFIADEELGLTKLEYKNKNIDIHEFYKDDPINYLLYNIADVCLCVRLNDKLKHIELQNLIRRNMKLNFSQSLIGSSALYDSFILHELLKSNKKIRHGIVTETGKEILQENLIKIPVPNTKNNKIKPDKISKAEYLETTYSFEGAYVKQSVAKIINTGTIIDLDASLPPDEKIFIRRNELTFWTNIGDYVWQLNDETLTWNDTNEIIWRKVLGKISHIWTNKHGKLLKFTTKSGKTVVVTDNHSIFCVQYDKKTNKTYIVDAKKLKINDSLVIIKQFESQGIKSEYWVQNCYQKNIILDPITKIEEINYEGDVYDISVEETERFFAGSGIGVHNTGLYPSMIRQFNIGFDTYHARVISPLAYKTLNVLEDYIGIKPLPANLFQNIYTIVDEYIEREGAANKTKAKNKLFYIISYHIYILAEKNIKLEKLYNPTIIQEVILLKQYLVPLIDLIDMIHNKHESYNEFIYDYIFDSYSNVQKKYPILYLINNAGSSNIFIEKLNVDNILNKLKNSIITINGACFLKHEQRTGIFVNFLNDMSQLRKSYRKLAANFEKGSDKYNFYNTRQLAIKVLMNSSYGVLGLKTFRYSNNHLAQSITSSGKLTIKLAQYLTDKYLTELEQ